MSNTDYEREADMGIKIDTLPPALRAQVERKAFVEWARSHIQNDQAQAAPLAASSLERLVGQED